LTEPDKLILKGLIFASSYPHYFKGNCVRSEFDIQQIVNAMKELNKQCDKCCYEFIKQSDSEFITEFASADEMLACIRKDPVCYDHPYWLEFKTMAKEKTAKPSRTMNSIVLGSAEQHHRYLAASSLINAGLILYSDTVVLPPHPLLAEILCLTFTPQSYVEYTMNENNITAITIDEKLRLRFSLTHVLPIQQLQEINKMREKLSKSFQEFQFFKHIAHDELRKDLYRLMTFQSQPLEYNGPVEIIFEKTEDNNVFPALSLPPFGGETYTEILPEKEKEKEEEEEEIDLTQPKQMTISIDEVKKKTGKEEEEEEQEEEEEEEKDMSPAFESFFVDPFPDQELIEVRSAFYLPVKSKFIAQEEESYTAQHLVPQVRIQWSFYLQCLTLFSGGGSARR